MRIEPQSPTWWKKTLLYPIKTKAKIKKIKDIPIIVLSARTEEFDKLVGFDLGIDDYVFSYDEESMLDAGETEWIYPIPEDGDLLTHECPFFFFDIDYDGEKDIFINLKFLHYFFANIVRYHSLSCTFCC